VAAAAAAEVMVKEVLLETVPTPEKEKEKEEKARGKLLLRQLACLWMN
jgi:hypothetical protein